MLTLSNKCNIYYWFELAVNRQLHRESTKRSEKLWKCPVKYHPSPLRLPCHTFQINPDQMETIQPVHPGVCQMEWKFTMEITITEDEDEAEREALLFCWKIHASRYNDLDRYICTSHQCTNWNITIPDRYFLQSPPMLKEKIAIQIAIFFCSSHQNAQAEI